MQNPHSPIPSHSICYPTEDATQAAKDLVFIRELHRQAKIGASSLSLAHDIALQILHGDDPDLDEVWMSLQAGLFASTVIYRILWPGQPMRKVPGLTGNESRKLAAERGKRLRRHLDVDESSHLRLPKDVRDSIEHLDERLDATMAGGALSISDCYLVDRYTFLPSPEKTAAILRSYDPIGGFLVFDEFGLSVFALHIALLDLQIESLEAAETLGRRLSGRGRHGGSPVRRHNEEYVNESHEIWLRMRADALSQIGGRVRIRRYPGTLWLRFNEPPEGPESTQ